MSDPISAPVRAVLELFAGELSLVKFPDLDVSVLRNAAELVSSRAEALSQAESAMERARVELGEAQEALLHRSHRALAYARVFAEEDPVLAAKVEGLTLPRPPRKQPTRALDPMPESTAVVEAATAPAPTAVAAPPKRRGRPPKATSSSGALFGAPASDEASEARSPEAPTA